MEADRRMDGDETSDTAALFKPREHIWQWRVGEPVTIVGEKDLFVLDKVPDGNEALTDIAPGSGIDERHAPIYRKIANDLDFLAKIRNNAVAVGCLPVIEKKIFDDIGFVSQAKDKITMAILTVILHHMPENRLMANRHHWFGNALGIFTDACAETSAEQDYFHIFLPHSTPHQLEAMVTPRLHILGKLKLVDARNVEFSWDG